MWLNVVLNLIIIAIWSYVSVLSFSFYSGGKFNRFMFKNAYVIGSLNILQAILAIYYIVTGDSSMQQIRWISFGMIEMNFLQFALRGYKKRHIELLIMAFFNVLIIANIVHWSLFVNCVISLTLIILSYFSGVKILKKYFTWIFALYGMTGVVPSIFGITTTESLIIGVIFSLSFVFGIIKLYKHEKTDLELKQLLLENKI